MTLTCPNCGIKNSVMRDSEFTFCTSCGGIIEIGIHSYRSESNYKKVACYGCGQIFDQNTFNEVFSCDNCGVFVCSVCSKIKKFKHYCETCYSALFLTTEITNLKKTCRAEPVKRTTRIKSTKRIKRTERTARTTRTTRTKIGKEKHHSKRRNR